MVNGMLLLVAGCRAKNSETPTAVSVIDFQGLVTGNNKKSPPMNRGALGFEPSLI
jgi:hypothetical protein